MLTPDEALRLEALIEARARPLAPPLTPELRFWGADDATELWEATEEALDRLGLAPPFWAFAWPGGQALARLLLDRPDLAAGRHVVSLASGAALEAIAAAQAGARSSVALDIDPAAAIAARLNADLNAVAVKAVVADLLSPEAEADWIAPAELILVGDAFYEMALSEGLTALLARAAARGAQVLIGDPGRGFPTRAATRELATYPVTTDKALEDVETRQARVLEMTA